jgi:hypothetical protein
VKEVAVVANEYDNDDLFFGTMVSKAEVLALLSILDHVCAQVGFRDPDNLGVFDRFYKQRKAELETLFRSVEDGQPGLAARLHARFEAAKQILADDQI